MFPGSPSFPFPFPFPYPFPCPCPCPILLRTGAGTYSESPDGYAASSPSYPDNLAWIHADPAMKIFSCQGNRIRLPSTAYPRASILSRIRS